MLRLVVAVVLVALQVHQWVVVGVVGVGHCVGRWVQACVFLGCVGGLVRPAIGGVVGASDSSGVVECGALMPLNCVVALCGRRRVEGHLEALVSVGSSWWFPVGWAVCG